MEYGHFDKKNDEYVITNPATPRPWINYLTNEDYCAVVSHTGGGYSFYKDCGINRILRWAPGNFLADRPGRYVYLKDLATEQYWSLNWQPMRRELDFYEARHGLGYTMITTKAFGVTGTLTYFVPRKEPCEIWKVKIKNNTRRKRSFSLYGFVEWLIGEYFLELRIRNITTLYNKVWWDGETGAILGKKTASWKEGNITPFEGLVFFGSNFKVASYDCQKVAFTGRYNDISQPDGLKNKTLKNSNCEGEDAVGVLEHSFDLDGLEEKEFAFILGQAESKKRIKEILKKYQVIIDLRKEQEAVRKDWQAKTSLIKVDTPDKDFNILVNSWLPYQLYINAYWSRNPSYYHGGGPGRGYRCNVQDTESILSLNPDFAKRRIKEFASLIRPDGTNAIGWSLHGPWDQSPMKGKVVWFTYLVSAYVRETGDIAVLKENLPYLKDKWCPQGADEGSIIEHIYKQLDYSWGDRGEHGLPRIGRGDWNDGLDLAGVKGKGESVMIAQTLVRALKQASELAELVNDKKKAEELKGRAEDLTKTINQNGWDGQWYLRGFKDSGESFGSDKNKEGKIYLNTQTWAILSGCVPRDRLKKISEAIDKYLDTPHGLALFAPAYSQYDPELGRIAMFAKGTKENAAIFCHANLFKIAADLFMGKGQRAWQSLKKIMPNKQKDYELYKTEPYVFSEYLIGLEHPYLFGEGAFSWLTGTAGWAYMLSSEWILGARRELDGLKIDPCLPTSWKKCKIKRPFRDATYEILIENPKGVEHGVKEVYVDGKKIEGQLIEPHKDGKNHKIKVIMGK
jgi:cellobiose phosphorylase